MDGFTDVIHLFNNLWKAPALYGEGFAERIGQEEREAAKFVQSNGENNTKVELVDLLGLSIIPTNHGRQTILHLVCSRLFHFSSNHGWMILMKMIFDVACDVDHEFLALK